MLLMALSAAVGQAFGRFSYGVLLPAVRDDMGISNTLAGFIGGANVGAYLVGTLLCLGLPAVTGFWPLCAWVC